VLTLLALVPALALAQQKPIKVMQDGSLLGNGWWSGNGTYATLDCVAPVTCTRNAATGVVQITSSGGGGGAPTNATYITQTANASLSNEQALSSLSTGLVKVTTGTGVLSTASSGTDYAPATSGTALQLARCDCMSATADLCIASARSQRRHMINAAVGKPSALKRSAVRW
jgi:hypothetical protein